MTTKLNQKDEQHFSELIRNNHFHLYENLINICSFKAVKNPYFSSIASNNMEWPNMIYDLNFRNNYTDALLKDLSNKIKAKKIPEFILIDSFTKPDDFDIQARKYAILPVMRWPGMIFQSGQKIKTRDVSSNFKIKKVDCLNMLKDWISLANINLFPNKGLSPDVLKALIGKEKIELLLGFLYEKPVSTLLLNYHQDTLGLYMGSTLPDFLGNGFMSSLINFSISEAASKGYTYSILEATRQSSHIYSILGFQYICNFDIYWKSQ